MLDVYAFATPNSIKVPIVLEDSGSITRFIRSISARASKKRTISSR